MTANPMMDPAHFVDEQLAQASPDLLRELMSTFINTLMSADADAVCGATYGASSPERVNSRNGYRHRDFDTRVRTLATSYLLGVSTRRMEKLVETLGVTRLSKSQVSEMAKDLDGQVEAFRTRRLDAPTRS